MKSWRIISVLLLVLLGVDAFGITCAPKNASTGFFSVSVSRARYYKPDTGRFWTMDTFEGNQSDPLSLHRYAADNPVNLIDPSGHENTSTLVTTMGNIGYLAGRTFAAVSNARWMAYARLTPVIEKGWQALFWADVAVTTVGAAAIVAPEVLNLAADLGTKINRAYTMNTVEIPTAPGQGLGGQLGYGYTIENIGGQQGGRLAQQTWTAKPLRQDPKRLQRLSSDGQEHARGTE